MNWEFPRQFKMNNKKVINNKIYTIIDSIKNKYYKNSKLLILSSKGKKYPIIGETLLFSILSDKPIALKYEHHLQILKLYLDSTIKTKERIKEINKLILFLNNYKDDMILK